MIRKSNRLLSIFMAFFMCFNNLVMPVVAEGEDIPEATEEPVIEVVQEEEPEEVYDLDEAQSLIDEYYDQLLELEEANLRLQIENTLLHETIDSFTK